MTKLEAIKAMKDGVKVTHPTFTEDEWIIMEGNNIIITEEGYAISDKEFWAYRTEQAFQDDWYIWGSKH